MIFETTTLSAVRRFVAHFNKKEKMKKNHPVDKPPGGNDLHNGDA